MSPSEQFLVFRLAPDMVKHIHPPGDTYAHSLNKDISCWCNPDLMKDPASDGYYLLHKAADSRKDTPVGKLIYPSGKD